MHGESLRIWGFQNPKTLEILWMCNGDLTSNEQEATLFSDYKNKGSNAVDYIRLKYTHLKHWKIVRKSLD